MIGLSGMNLLHLSPANITCLVWGDLYLPPVFPTVLIRTEGLSATLLESLPWPQLLSLRRAYGLSEVSSSSSVSCSCSLSRNWASCQKKAIDDASIAGSRLPSS